jgi:hypothetical protein
MTCSRKLDVNDKGMQEKRGRSVNKEDLSHKAKILTHKARRELVKHFVRGQHLTKHVVAEAYDRASQGAVRLSELRSSLSRKGQEIDRDSDHRT